MYKTIFNKRRSLKFKRFANKGYALFSVLGKEVLVGTLSIATLSHARAAGISTDVNKAASDSTFRKEQQLDEVDVTASRAPLTRSQQARMVTVLTRKDIAAAPVQSVNDLLKYAVGVDVRQRCPIGAQTDVSIRGGNDEQITILLNGINICDPQTGHNAFDLPVDLSDIERIEVLEGPAGRIYGTSSLLGAINIVTRTPRQSSLTAHAEGGSFGYLSAGGRANIAKGYWNNQISGSYTRSDGFSRNKAGHLNMDYKGGKTFYQGNYEDPDIQVNWYAGMSTKNWGSSTSYSSRFDDQFEHTFKTYTALQAENKTGIFHLKPSIYWNRTMDRFELFRGAADKYPFNYHRTDVYGVNLNGYFDWLLGRTAIGAEIRDEDLVSTNLGETLEHPRPVHGTGLEYLKGVNRTNVQFVLEHNILLSRFTLSAGLIAVKNSWADMNMRVYPGIDASYRIGNNWKLYASFNTSLRMPSFTELYYSVGGYLADPHLKPEELSALETGIKYQAQGISGKASIYNNHYKNLIDWIYDGSKDESGSPVWKSVNFGKINSLGVETSLDFDFLQLIPDQHFLQNFQLSYSYINQTKHERTGIQSIYALEYLKNKLVTDVELNLWHNLDLGLQYRLQHRMGSYVDVNGHIHSYTTYGILDGKLSWREKKWNAYLEANNILDKDYVEVGNVPQPGFWLIAGMSINLPF
ncbi:MAG: TonB-dependent receptor [Prevotella sp.]|jgi:iron complex outermembrane receptor protein|nr:TonB-dependent receptor [Prevotella sp.]MCI2124908.1 TonB-dependent receptor [Prevotella sp.]